MKNPFLAIQIFVVSFALNAFAGGTGSTQTCKHIDKVLISAPMQVYLPDGMTKQTVGEASLVSRKTICDSGEYEVIDIRFNLDDEIKPYGIKIKDTITAFENEASVEFRLKELVNSTERFDTSTYGKTKINHFGSVGTLEVEMKKPAILFWGSTQSTLDGVITADTKTPLAEYLPLACSLERGYVTLTKKAKGSDGLQKDLTLTAIFRGPLQLCP